MKRTLAAFGAVATLACAGALLQAQARLAVETFDARVDDRSRHAFRQDTERRRLGSGAHRTAAASGGGRHHDSELRAVIRDMLGRLGQSHFALIPSTADSTSGDRGDLTAGPGFEVRLLDRNLVVTAVSIPRARPQRAGVRPGWIVAIDRRTQCSGAARRVCRRRCRSGCCDGRSVAPRRNPSARTGWLDSPDRCFVDGDSKTVSLGARARARPGPAGQGRQPADDVTSG